MLSAITTFKKSPQKTQYKPLTRFSFDIDLAFNICGNNLVPLSIRPATNCGKKATYREKSKKFLHALYESSKRALKI